MDFLENVVPTGRRHTGPLSRGMDFGAYPLGDGPGGNAGCIRDEIRPRKHITQNGMAQPGATNRINPSRMVELAEFICAGNCKGQDCRSPSRLERKEDTEPDEHEQCPKRVSRILGPERRQPDCPGARGYTHTNYNGGEHRPDQSIPLVHRFDVRAVTVMYVAGGLPPRGQIAGFKSVYTGGAGS